MNVMGLHAAGWHDIFLKGSIKNYTGLHSEADCAGYACRTTIDYWAMGTCANVAGREGRRCCLWQERSDGYDGTDLKWFDYTLKGIQNEYAGAKPVRIFVMGDNVWRDEQEFPLARTRYTNYYLHSLRGANGASGDGELTVNGAGRGATGHSFEYDPKNPVPTIGGRLCCGTSAKARTF